jgi:hypothetical protein
VAQVGMRNGAPWGRAGRGEAVRGWWRTSGAGLVAESGDTGRDRAANVKRGASGGAGQDEERWCGAGRGEPVQGCWRTGGTGLVVVVRVGRSS